MITCAAILGVVVVYVVGASLIQARLYRYYEAKDLFLPRLVDATIVIWLIYFGSAIGSFLNVVAWRMPRGQAIGGRSRCPRCNQTLSSRDNVPILGWISLRGRCRFCGLPISRRYPIIEACVGISLTLVGMAELYSLALPDQAVHWHGGPMWAPHVTPFVMAVLTYHALALSTLWALALIRVDGAAVPVRLRWFGFLAVVLPMLLYPTSMIVPWQADRPPGWTPDGLYYDAVMRVMTALVAAALFGRVLAKGLCPTADLKLDPLGGGTSRLVDLISMLAIPSVLIGWQSMPALVIAAAILSLVIRPLIDRIPINDTPRGQIRQRGAMEYFAFALPLALTTHLVLWRWLWSQSWWPSDQSGRWTQIVWALAVLAVPLVLRESTKEAEPRSAPESSIRSDEESGSDDQADPDVGANDFDDGVNGPTA
ncbi:prepilin peptidase [Roseiconus nitratireducens]|uniref:Prepilin peptidase n=2 Tax=Roseiconus nitratireducens TaxID=2605748 RepID=A0A5M6CWN5_9BACT|nr:prepilin peptidase [Roseiconus nitratireducens]